MPMCGPRRRGSGSPHWSSSGSTVPPPSSSGHLWRTNLQLAVALASSLSATLNLRMTGEMIFFFFYSYDILKIFSAEMKYKNRHRIIILNVVVESISVFWHLSPFRVTRAVLMFCLVFLFFCKNVMSSWCTETTLRFLNPSFCCVLFPNEFKISFKA